MKTIVEFAKEKGCSRQSIYDAINKGKLETIRKYGKQLLKDTPKNRDWEPKNKLERSEDDKTS